MNTAIPAVPSDTKGADLVTVLNDRIRRINMALSAASGSVTNTIIKTGGGVAPAGEVSYGTHAQRLAAPTSAFADAAMWYETDRTVWYQFQAGIVSAGSWVWIAGTFSCVQANLPTDLSTNDVGFLVSVTDYNHVLAWSGSAWTAGFGWDTPGYIRGFQVDPSPTTGWKLCDGNGDDGSAIGVAHPVTYLKSDGTLGSITSATVAPCVPNLVGSAALLEFGSAASGITAASAPTLTMNSYTPAGSVSAPTFTGSGVSTSSDSAGTPSGTNSAPTFSGGSQSFGTVNFVSAAGTTAALISPTSITYSGSVSAPTFTGNAMGTHSHTVTAAGTVSAPTFTGTPATLTGAVDATGLPPRITLRPWFRK